MSVDAAKDGSLVALLFADPCEHAVNAAMAAMKMKWLLRTNASRVEIVAPTRRQSNALNAMGGYRRSRSGTARKPRGFSRAVRGTPARHGATYGQRRVRTARSYVPRVGADEDEPEMPFSTAQAASWARDPKPSFASALAT
jgi:hypothetical protein